MKKTININLGGFPFTIDDDAYEQLKQYLDVLNNHFQKSEDAEEIIMDIESRMAELMQERLQGNHIIVISDIDAVISTMGTPEDFGAESMEEETTYKKKFSIKTGKRLYRNPDDAILGGVASGLSAYFGIQDPVWIRILFVITLLTAGFGFPLYIVLWVLLKEAQTASEKLEMRGEPININNIAKTIEEEVENLGKRIDEFSKKKAKPYASNLNTKLAENNIEFRKIFKKGFRIIRKIAVIIETIVRSLHKSILMVFIICAIIFFASFWVSSIVTSIIGIPYSHYFMDDSTYTIAIISILLAIGIPLLSGVLSASKMLFKTTINKGLQIGLIVAWVVGLTGLGFSIATIGKTFGASYTNTQTTKFQTNLADTVNLNISGRLEQPYINLFDQIKLADEEFVSENVLFTIKKSDTDQMSLEQTMTANGSTETMARQNINNAEIEMSVEDNTLNISPSFKIKKEKQWKAHALRYTLKVPVGKKLNVNNEAEHFHLEYYTVKDSIEMPFFLSEGMYEMTNEGLQEVEN